MTDDERKALIARLRDGRWKGETTCGPAADQIEADGKRIAELEAALLRIFDEDRRVVDRWRQSMATGDSHLDTQIVLGRYAEIAREAFTCSLARYIE